MAAFRSLRWVSSSASNRVVGRRVAKTDTRIAFEIKQMIANQHNPSGETARTARYAHNITHRILLKLQEHVDNSDQVNEKTITTALWVLNKYGLPRTGPRLFKHAVEVMKIPVSVEMYNNLAASYAASGNAERMYDTLRTMKERGFPPNSYTFNVCITACGVQHMKEEVYRLFEMMPKYGVSPDAQTWARLISACQTVDQAGKALSAVKMQHHVTYVHYNAVLTVCMRVGDMQTAEFYFNAMMHNKFKHCRPNTISYTILMTLYKEKGLFPEMVEVYNRMKKYAVTPNSATYVVFLQACGNMAKKQPNDAWRYAEVAVTAVKQALVEGIDDARMLSVAGRFLCDASTLARMVEVKQRMEELDVEVPSSYLRCMTELKEHEATHGSRDPPAPPPQEEEEPDIKVKVKLL